MNNSVNQIDFETYIKENPIVPEAQKVSKPETPTTKSKQIRTHRGDVTVPQKVKIQKSPVHNQGVFANVDILEDEIIEVAPLLQLGWRTQYHNDPVIKKYIWSNVSCNCNDCKMNSPIAYIPLGYAALYNHSDTPNVSMTVNWTEQTVTFKANKTILANEELFINYGKDYWKSRENDKR